MLSKALKRALIAVLVICVILLAFAMWPSGLTLEEVSYGHTTMTSVASTRSQVYAGFVTLSAKQEEEIQGTEVSPDGRADVLATIEETMAYIDQPSTVWQYTLDRPKDPLPLIWTYQGIVDAIEHNEPIGTCCASFVSYLYIKAGVLQEKYFTPSCAKLSPFVVWIDFEDAQPGDLVFFCDTYDHGRGPDTISHVGIVTDVSNPDEYKMVHHGGVVPNYTTFTPKYKASYGKGYVYGCARFVEEVKVGDEI